MSHGLLEDTGLENPLAVHIRNFPVSLINQDKFKECISIWRGVDLRSSSCHPNPNNAAWNGWAIVYFENELARNNFIANDSQHFVKDVHGEVHKLKVKKWLEKHGQTIKSTTFTPSQPPSQKSEIIYREPTLEDFERRISEASSKCFKGRIKSYLSENGQPKLCRLGYSGLIAVSLFDQGKRSEELVLFHSGSVWVCTVHTYCRGTQDCAHKCTPADNLPAKLKVDSEVFLTVRRVPSDIQCSVSYQAKCVWQGEAYLPDFVTTPARLKLDNFLDEYVDQVDPLNLQSDTSKPASPAFAHDKEKKVPGSAGTSGGGGVSRQKPLTGGLKQLNSDLTKKFVTKVEKKQAPTNFAEAVAAAAKTEQQILADSGEAVDIVEKAVIESFPGRDRALVRVGDHGRYFLEPRHFENNVKDLQAYLTDNSNLLVALSLNKESKSSGKYVVVRAFAENQKPESRNTNGNIQEVSPGKAGNDERKSRNRNESSLDIDFVELDRYYDIQHEISEYLRCQIPKLIPDLKPSSNFIATLINSIITAENENTGDSDVDILNKFFSHHKFNINANQRQNFIADYCHFKSWLLSRDSDKESNTTALCHENGKQHNGIKKSDSENVFGANNLQLSKIETEFMNKHKNKERDSSILRAIILFRKAGISMEKFTKSHKDHSKSTSYPMIDSQLKMFINQKILDETNYFLKTSGCEEVTPGPCRKLNSYLPSLYSLMTNFIMAQNSGGEGSEGVYKRESDRSTTNSVSSSSTSSPLRSLSSTKSTSPYSRSSAEKHDVKTSGSPATKHAGSPLKDRNSTKKDPNIEQFDKLEDYLDSMNLSNVNMSSMLARRNLTLHALFELYEVCRKVGEGGKMKWNLEITKLKLTPAMGITVFKIAELLWNFFSLHPIEKAKPTLSLPSSVFSIYNTEDFSMLKKGLCWKQFEENLFEGIEILCYSSILLKSPEDLKDYASIIGKLWRSCDMKSETLENDIQHIMEEEDITLENYFHPLRKVLAKWAAHLEKLTVLKNTSLNVLNIIKATLTSYHPNVYEGYNVYEYESSEYEKYNIALFKNIAHDNKLPGSGRLYATEGVVVGRLDAFVVVQTMFCKVLVHPAVYLQDHKLNTEMEAAHLTGLLTLNSCPISDESGNFVFHLATLAWTSSLTVDHGDEPFPGALLPFPDTFYTTLTKLARESAATENSLDLGNLDPQEQKICFGMVWFQQRAINRSRSNSGLDESKESVVLSALLDAKLVSVDILNSTILKYYLDNSVTRFMPADEFLHMFNPYLRSTNLFDHMTEYLRSMSGQSPRERIKQLLAKFPSSFNKILIDSCRDSEAVKTSADNLTTATAATATTVKTVAAKPTADEVLRTEKPDPSESNVIAKIEDILSMVQENKAAITKIEKRLDDLDQIVLSIPGLLVNSQNGGGSASDRKAVKESVKVDRCYVRVWREEEGEVEEIPTNKEGNLDLATILSIFPGTQGLKFRVTSNGRLAWRNLLLENSCIHPPEDGWGDRVYLARGCVQQLQGGGGVGGYRSDTSCQSVAAASSSSTISYLPNHMSMSSAASSNSSEQLPVTRVSNSQQQRSTTSQLVQLQTAHGHQLSQMPADRSNPMPQLQPGHAAQLPPAAAAHMQQQQLQPEHSSAGQVPRPGRNRSSQLSQLMMNQTPSSIWASSPATILGGISPVSLDFQDSTNNYGLRDQLN